MVRQRDSVFNKPTEGNGIGTRRTTSGKRDREAAKKNRAAAKRERRAARVFDDKTALAVEHEGESAEQLLEELKRLHDDFEAEAIGFDDFDARKQDLLDRIATTLAYDEST